MELNKRKAIGLVLRAQWDRVVALLLVVGATVALVLGWVGVSGAVYPAEQLPYVISGGLGALFLLGLGATLWLSADLRDEWRHLDEMEARIDRRIDERVAVAIAEQTHLPANGTRSKTRARRAVEEETHA